ncbi:MAG: phosphoadenosine phosphosulfate reductase family protein [Candidatus Thorarchaeota archaeon]
MKKKKPYLGPLLLAWCDSCNVPLVRRARCNRCGSQARPVPVTPPGDARPAFPEDRNKIIESISIQYGKPVAEDLIPADKIVLLNAIPDIDCTEEIIVDGQIIGLHRFQIATLSWVFIPKMEGARRIIRLTKTKQVIIEDAAVNFIVKGANLLRPGIKTADSSIRPDEYVIGVTEQGFAVLVGIATMTGQEMLTKERGMAIKKRYKAEPQLPKELASGQTWQTVLEANSHLLQRIENESLDFIKNTVHDYQLPPVVAFSGGKDSLAVLLLTKKALSDTPFHVMFIDTGIEFPETVENVYTTTAKLGLEEKLLVKHVEKDQFFRVLELYGFVARDYRVCCKTVKLGPTSQLIDEHFPEGCLSFIGQRRYESHRRSVGGRIWKNPWVPKQLGASPIHNWTALMIWLYLFHEKAPYNPLYEAGFERIGCMFCPASPMSELQVIAEKLPTEWKRWYAIAEKITQQQGLNEKWLNHGFWRWKNPPPNIQDLAEQMGIELPSKDRGQLNKSVSYNFSLEHDQTTQEALIRGQFSAPIDLQSAAAFLPALGSTVIDLERTIIEVTIHQHTGQIRATLFESGYFVLTGAVTPEDASKFARTVLRGLLCTGCGTCQSLCESDAIILDLEKAYVKTEECIQCGKCLRGKCPTLYAL